MSFGPGTPKPVNKRTTPERPPEGPEVEARRLAGDFSLNIYRNDRELGRRFKTWARTNVKGSPQNLRSPRSVKNDEAYYKIWERWRQGLRDTASPATEDERETRSRVRRRSAHSAGLSQDLFNAGGHVGGVDAGAGGGGDQDSEAKQVDPRVEREAKKTADQLQLNSAKVQLERTLMGSTPEKTADGIINRGISNSAKGDGHKPPRPPGTPASGIPGPRGPGPANATPGGEEKKGPRGTGAGGGDPGVPPLPGVLPRPGDVDNEGEPEGLPAAVPCDQGGPAGVRPAQDMTRNPNFSTTDQGGAALPSQFQDSTNPRYVGSLGSRTGRLENEATPGGASSYQGIVKDGQGDRIEDVTTVETAVDTLRAQYGMESAGKVIPSTRDQLMSDIRFDLFDTVNPGYGEGSDNKLFLMQEGRDEKIIYSKPMFEPGSYIGPIAGVTVPPWQLQRVMPADKMKDYGESRQGKLKMIQNTVMSYGKKSTNLLGDDVGYPFSHSACELKRNSRSPFEPVIRTDMNWEHVKDPVGHELNKKRFRLETDAQRYPRHLDSRVNGMGGPVLKKRRGLEVILQ
jgi:hypothetical protein